jgi:hypothetical protein
VDLEGQLELSSAKWKNFINKTSKAQIMKENMDPFIKVTICKDKPQIKTNIYVCIKDNGLKTGTMAYTCIPSYSGDRD